MDKMINLEKRVRNNVKLPKKDQQKPSKDYFLSGASPVGIQEPESEIIYEDVNQSDQIQMLDSFKMQIDEIQPENEKEPNVETPMCIFDINPESKFMHQGIDRQSLPYKMETKYSATTLPSTKKAGDLASSCSKRRLVECFQKLSLNENNQTKLNGSDISHFLQVREQVGLYYQRNGPDSSSSSEKDSPQIVEAEPEANPYLKQVSIQTQRSQESRESQDEVSSDSSYLTQKRVHQSIFLDFHEDQMLQEHREEKRFNESLLKARCIKKAKRRKTEQEIEEDDKAKIQMRFISQQENINPNELYKQRLLDKLQKKTIDSRQQLQVYGGGNTFQAQKKILLKSVFKFYLSHIVRDNLALTNSYISRIQEEYSKLGEHQQVSINDIKNSILEMETNMEVDEQQKNQIVDFLLQQTNITDFIMMDEERESCGTNSFASNTSSNVMELD